MASPRLAKGDTLLLPTILRGCLVRLSARTMYATINELSQDCIVDPSRGRISGAARGERWMRSRAFSRREQKEPLPSANYCAIKP